MDEKKITKEPLLYALAFILAISFRLFNLGAIPLNEFEADWALQAFQIAQGQSVVIGPQPAYVMLTSILFSIFGSSDALARVLPAILGSTILYLPFVLREKLGKTAALVFAFGLALDPGLVSLSRLAGGPMLALSFMVLAIAFWLSKKTTLAGVMFALTLLSGAGAWVGLSLILISIVIYKAIYKKEVHFQIPELTKTLTLSGIVFILVATNLFRNPNGISAFGASFSVFLSGFTTSSQIPFGRLNLALFSYQPIAILFMILGFFKNKNRQNDLIKFSRIFLLLIIGFLLIYPSRQVSYLALALVPLWLLASITIAEFFETNMENKKIIIVWQTIAVLSLFALVFLNLINLSSHQQPAMLADFVNAIGQGQFGAFGQLDLATKAYLARFATLILIPLMIVLFTVLLGFWSDPKVSWRAFTWGVLILLFVYTASSLWGGSYLRSRQVNELWSPGNAAGNPELLLDTIEDLSEFNAGTRQDVDVVSLVESDSLAWVLRFMPNLRFRKELAYNEFPSIVITDEKNADPSLNSAYRGQSFVLSRYKSWKTNALPPNFLSWLLFRDTGSIPELIILWAKTDLFPGYVEVNDETITEDVLPTIELP